MKRVTLIAIAVLALCGCATLNQDYVKADKLTFDAIAPEYLQFVDANPNFDKEQRDRRHRTVETWKLRLEKAGK